LKKLVLDPISASDEVMVLVKVGTRLGVVKRAKNLELDPKFLYGLKEARCLLLSVYRCGVAKVGSKL
jgi:hypothetical protein